MKQQKLISMSDFVLQVVQTPNTNEAICWEQTEARLNKIYQYALFLKQPLTIGMFVPCDLENNIVKEPNYCLICGDKGYMEGMEKPCVKCNRNGDWRCAYPNKVHKQYQEAQNRVLFENLVLEKITPFGMTFILNDKILFFDCEDITIEDLIEHNLTLTETALKQFT